MKPLKTRIHAAIMAALLSVSGASRQKQIPSSLAVKLLFSSKWRIAADRRELCFIIGNGNTISLRSLLDLAAEPANPRQ
jgi:hypothetical protein